MKALKVLMIVALVSFSYNMVSAQTTAPTKTEKREKMKERMKAHPKAAKRAMHHHRKHKI